MVDDNLIKLLLSDPNISQQLRKLATEYGAIGVGRNVVRGAKFVGKHMIETGKGMKKTLKYIGGGGFSTEKAPVKEMLKVDGKKYHTGRNVEPRFGGLWHGTKVPNAVPLYGGERVGSATLWGFGVTPAVAAGASTISGEKGIKHKGAKGLTGDRPYWLQGK